MHSHVDTSFTDVYHCGLKYRVLYRREFTIDDPGHAKLIDEHTKFLRLERWTEPHSFGTVSVKAKIRDGLKIVSFHK